MKKVAFILSLILFSIGFTPAQAAQCKDGTYSSSTGRGTCSGHGGVASWGSAPAQSISKAAVEANLKRQQEIAKAALIKAAADKAIKDKADADARKLGFKNAAAKVLSDKLAESKRIADERLEQAKNEAEMEAAKQASLSASYKKYDEDILSANNLLNSELQNINTLFLAKSNSATLAYANAYSKWKEISQVKISSGPYFNTEVTFYNERWGLVVAKLDSQDQDRRPGIPYTILGHTLIGNCDPKQLTPACAPQGRIAVIYPIVAYGGNSLSQFDTYRELTWDFEQNYYLHGVHASSIIIAMGAWQNGWIYSVRKDGTKVNYIESEMIRTETKNSYAKILSLEKEYKTQVALINVKFGKLIDSIKSAHKEEVKTITEGN
jgi:hypothetical protein